MKVVTICGSLKFTHEMMIEAQKLALNGNCVLAPVYPVTEKMKMSKEQLKKLKEEHLKKIELSDAILVINKNNYIGESTRLEIEYAKSLNKEVTFLF